jgi:dTDP-D-glucose 4,6-dehydratase
MRLVVTGGAGFIGYAVVCRAIGDGHAVLTVDKLTYAGRMQALNGVNASPRYQFLKADITDSRAMDGVFGDFQPDAVLHLAVESHVDHVAGLMATLQHGRPGSTYLFGGRCDVRNLDLAHAICRILDTCVPRSDKKDYASQIDLVTDRPGHDFRYSIDPSHAENTLAWKASEELETGLTKTIDWYLANPECLVPGTVLGRLGSRNASIIGATL